MDGCGHRREHRTRLSRLRRLKPDSGSQLADHKASCVKSASQQSLKEAAQAMEAACVALPSESPHLHLQLHYFFPPLLRRQCSSTFCGHPTDPPFTDTPGLGRTLLYSGLWVHCCTKFLPSSHTINAKHPFRTYTEPSAESPSPQKGRPFEDDFFKCIAKQGLVCMHNA